MKTLSLLALLLSASLAAHGQTTEAALNFCGLSIPVTTGCAPEAGCVLRCDKYELKWAYLDYRQLSTVADVVVKAEMKQFKEAEKMPLEALILNTPAKGYRLSYLTDAGMAYELVLAGVAKGQPVLVQLTMNANPRSTADLPEPARLIVQLLEQQALSELLPRR